MQLSELMLSYTEKKNLRQFYAEYKNSDNKSKCDLEEVFKTDHQELSKIGVVIGDLPKLIYSENQLKFIKSVKRQKMIVIYDYSGRGMYGDICPAVICNYTGELRTSAKTSSDSMGLNVVIYASK